MRLVTGTAIVLFCALAPARGSADVVPPGWAPPPRAEETHVAMLRASIAAWASPSERALLDARIHPRCVASAPRRGTGFGGGRTCPDLDSIRTVAIDRAVRFFAAEILDAEGRSSDAAALRDAAPMRDPEARASVVPRLSEASVAPARELAQRGMTSSLEQIAAALGRLLEAALRAGVPRDRLVGAAVEMLAELAHPMASVRVRVEQDGDALPVTIAHGATSCLGRHVDMRWRPVAVRIVVHRGAGGIAVASTGPEDVRGCVEHAVRRALGAGGAPSGVHVARVVAGPEGVLWGAPIEL